MIKAYRSRQIIDTEEFFQTVDLPPVLMNNDRALLYSRAIHFK